MDSREVAGARLAAGFSIILHYAFIRAESGARWYKTYVLIHTGIRSSFLLSNFRSRELSPGNIQRTAAWATSSIKLNFTLAILASPSVVEAGDIALLRGLVINSRCSAEFQVNSCESCAIAPFAISPVASSSVSSLRLFSSFDAGYAERVRVRTRIELDAALLNTQCDLFETRRIKHKGPRMIGKLLRRTGFVGQSRSALK